MDEFNFDMLDEEEEKEQEVAVGKEQTVILIDAQEAMLAPCDLPDPRFKGTTWLGAMLKVVAAMLRSKVVAGATDETALMFYNTSQSRGASGAGGVAHVYTLQGMDAPDVKSILEVEQLTPEEFAQRVGSGPSEPGSHVAGLANGLWQAASMLPTPAGTGPRPVQRVMVCTRDRAPQAELKAGPLRQHAEAIANKGASVQLFPLAGPSEQPFELPPFWAELLEAAAPKPAAGAGKVAAAEGVAATSAADDFFEERVMHIDDLVSVVRQRTYSKRALTRVTWQLGPSLPPGDACGLPPATIGVSLYKLLHSASKGAHVWLHSLDNTPLTSHTAKIDEQTGSIVTEPKLFYPAKAPPNCLFPRIYVTPQEVRELKSPLPKGLTLLGFKSLAVLEAWHQLREPVFMYPDEASVGGSTRAFVALHSCMVRAGVMAVCALVRTPSAEPQLVAALPQVEEYGEYGGQQTPPGFHLIYLPFADDVRTPEVDPSFTGDQRAVPPEAAVAAAGAMVDALQIPEFDPGDVPNPHLQRHFWALECIALALTQEEQGAAPEDETLPDQEAFEAAGDLIGAFKDAAYGAGYTADVAPQGAKRKATAEPTDAASLAAEVAEFPALAQRGQLASKTVAQLKQYLQLHNQKLGGNKGELVARIETHMRTTGLL